MLLKTRRRLILRKNPLTGTLSRFQNNGCFSGRFICILQPRGAEIPKRKGLLKLK